MARKKDTVRKQRYRERLRQQRPAASPADIDAQVKATRKLARPDAPIDLIHDYVGVSDDLNRERAGKGRSRHIQELATTKLRYAEALGITPREKRIAGEKDADSIGDALAKSMANVEKIRAAEWVNLKGIVAVFGGKMIGEKAIFEEDLIMQIGDLKRRRPKLFSEAEMAMTSRELFDAIRAARPHPPAAEQPAVPDDGEEPSA